MNSEFYVGYLDRSPPGLARHTRLRVAILLGLVATLLSVLAASQHPAEPGRFDFGVPHTFEGVLHEFPIPMLQEKGPEGAIRNHLLVGFGKHGLPDFARGHDGERVRFRGSIIEGGGLRMIELNDPRSFVTVSERDPLPASGLRPGTVEPLGAVTLIGELVDTKCYAGVMRPAVGKVHRACAARCLHGGVPPGLLLRGSDGAATVVLLVGPKDTELKVNAQWAARLLRAEGSLTIQEGQARLAVRSLSLVD